tara:strand:+ start:3369 stop:4010 length:642 start_codon:yes stop_codon:yes gene_type:complete
MAKSDDELKEMMKKLRERAASDKGLAEVTKERTESVEEKKAAPVEDSPEEKVSPEIKEEPPAEKEPTRSVSTVGRTSELDPTAEQSPAPSPSPQVTPSHSDEDVLLHVLENARHLKRCGKINVTKTFSESGKILSEVEGDTEILATPEFIGPTAAVSVDMGATMNLGDFNSAKVGVFVSVPCYTTEIDEAYAFATNKAKEFLNKEIKDIKGGR